MLHPNLLGMIVPMKLKRYTDDVLEPFREKRLTKSTREILESDCRK